MFSICHIGTKLNRPPFYNIRLIILNFTNHKHRAPQWNKLWLIKFGNKEHHEAAHTGSIDQTEIEISIDYKIIRKEN